ncbi:hypothetical protein RUND412_003732 [Rhizina undulata]
MSVAITGSQVIAQALHALNVKVIFGIVGIPVIEVAEACIALGIKFVSFRNEQAASYAATAYGFLTGKPGVCLVVGGPGVLHAMAGVGNSTVNATFPLLLLAGSAETTASPTKGAFQQLDAVSLLAPHIKLAIRPPTLESLPEAIRDAYLAAFYGRPGVGYVDLPADFIQGTPSSALVKISPVEAAPKIFGDEERVKRLAAVLKEAKRPLIIVGKGAAYARAEREIREFIERTQIPFLPTPQGKGVLPDLHPLNTSTARSAALKNADVAILLGARLNWILHFGQPSKWSATVRIAQIDICAEELGKHTADPTLAIHGDISAVISQLSTHLSTWRYSGPAASAWNSLLETSSKKNLLTAAKKSEERTLPLSYERTFTLIKNTLEELTRMEDLVFVSEGANTMDISRSYFPILCPRQRLDAGTYATMGVGLGYAIAAEIAYNHTFEASSPGATKKRVIALEGDSAFGFSLAEVETMSRFHLPIIMIVMNNGGVYHGISDNTEGYKDSWEKDERRGNVGLPSTALGFETDYSKLAEALGGRGWIARAEEELIDAVRGAWREQGPAVVDVRMRSGAGGKLEFAWLGKKEAKL